MRYSTKSLCESKKKYCKSQKSDACPKPKMDMFPKLILWNSRQRKKLTVILELSADSKTNHDEFKKKFVRVKKKLLQVPKK